MLAGQLPLLTVQIIVRIVRTYEMLAHRSPPKTLLMDGIVILL
jgi:hypothetical protein